MKKLGLAAFIIFFIAVGAVGAWFFRAQAYRTAPAPSATTPSPAAVTPPTTAAAATAVSPKPEVAIQNEKTIDFSSGKPVLKDSAEEKVIIANSVKEMNEAAAGITFGPAPKPAAKPPAPPQ